VLGTAFSPDGTRLAVVTSNALSMNRTATGPASVIWFLDPDSGQRLSDPIRLDASAGPIAFAPDNTTLAVAGNSGYLQLWDADTGESMGEPLTFNSDTGISGVAFSPDGKLLAAAGADSTVTLWDTETRELAGEPLNGHRGSVNDVAFSPDGRLIASSGVDNSVRLWDVASGQPFGEPLSGHTDGVNGLAFSPDGDLLASGDLDGHIRIWPAKADADDLCAKLSENMGRAQWTDWVSADIDYVKACPDLPIAEDR
jgi:WD40 repeat protein